MSGINVEDGKSYYIINAKGGTAIDLSGTDGCTVHGWALHRGDNQKWTTIRVHDGWHIKNAASGKYLALAGHVGDGVSVIGSTTPFVWHMWPEGGKPHEIRVCVPNAPGRQDLDLNDNGNRADGTPIKVWGRWNARNQVWFFEPV